jgi:hypothetical protein
MLFLLSQCNNINTTTYYEEHNNYDTPLSI